MSNVALLYCGSNLTKSLYDKLVELKVRPFLMPSDTPAEDVLAINPIAIIITGSPDYVNGPNAPRIDVNLYGCGVPMLGICYGMQLMARDLGGEVKRMASPEREWCHLELTNHPSELYQDFTEEGVPVWMLHTCKLTQVPEGFVVTGSTERSEIASMEDITAGLYAVQYHPEHKGRDPTSQAGTAIIWNFLKEICEHETP